MEGQRYAAERIPGTVSDGLLGNHREGVIEIVHVGGSFNDSVNVHGISFTRIFRNSKTPISD
jgi:hypothetical protein